MKKCVWLSQHTPTAEQRAWWENRGVALVTPLTPPRFANGTDAWNKAVALCAGSAPDYVVGVVPTAMLKDFLLAAGDTPFLRADMRAIMRGGDAGVSTYEWLGTFTRIVRVAIVTEPFTLEIVNHANG